MGDPNVRVWTDRDIGLEYEGLSAPRLAAGRDGLCLPAASLASPRSYQERTRCFHCIADRANAMRLVRVEPAARMNAYNGGDTVYNRRWPCPSLPC